MKARSAQVTGRLVCVCVCVFVNLHEGKVLPEVGGRWRELSQSHSVGGGGRLEEKEGERLM